MKKKLKVKMTNLINAGKGKKPRRKKREFPSKPDDSRIWAHVDFAVHINPLVRFDAAKPEEAVFGEADFKPMLKDQLLARIEQQGKSFYSFSIKESICLRRPDGKTEHIGEIINAVFPKSKYVSYEREHYMKNNIPAAFWEYLGREKNKMQPFCYTLVPGNEESQVELIDITVPPAGIIPYEPINSMVSQTQLFTDNVFVRNGYRANVFAIEILFKEKSFKRRKGLLIPLTCYDNRIINVIGGNGGNPGHLIAATYLKDKIVTDHYNIFDYSNSWAKGIEIAVNTKNNKFKEKQWIK